MNYYKLKFNNGTSQIEKAKNTLDLIKKHDLATKENINTTICQLEGEQLALAISNDQ